MSRAGIQCTECTNLPGNDGAKFMHGGQGVVQASELDRSESLPDNPPIAGFFSPSEFNVKKFGFIYPFDACINYSLAYDLLIG